MAIKSATRSTLENNIFYRSMLAGNAAFIPEDEYLLEEQILSSSAASVTFSGLEQYAGVYQHLQIRSVSRTDGLNQEEAFLVRFNGDTGANYARHFMFGNGSAVVSSAEANTSFIYPWAVLGGGATANTFGVHVIDILDSFETTKNKTLRALAGYASSTSRVALGSGHWRNTNALSSITIYTSASNLVSGSRFSLYGAK